MHVQTENSNKLSCHTGTVCHAMSFQLLSTAAQLSTRSFVG